MSTTLLPVLVIDDDAPTSELVTVALAEEGYRVVAVPSFRTALEWLDRERPGLIICDVVMPGMDLSTFVRAYRLSTREATAPLVLFSADLRAAERKQEVGAVEFLAKPFDLEDLYGVVDRHYTRSRSLTSSS